MSTKLDRCASRLNDEFPDLLQSAFEAKFGRAIETDFDILGSMRLVSRPTDGSDFTPDEKSWIAAYDLGYGEALSLVRLIANGA